jgi:methylenetetrahydrofolate dehydrogenase (NADP+)/methenyltetrahydrofolate cyclohydrolase
LTGNIISGNIVASFIKSEVKKEVENMKSKGRVIPCLATVLVGNDPASAIYVNNKQ